MNRARVLAALQKSSKKTPAPPPPTSADSPDPKPPAPAATSNAYHKRDVEAEVMEIFDLWDPMSEDYYSADNTLELNPDKEPECVVTGQMTSEYFMVGRYKVCDFYLKHGTCADGEYCSRLHIEPGARDKLREFQQSDAMKASKTCQFYHNLLPSELKPNPEALILVSLTSTSGAPNKFHMVAPYEQMNFSGFNHDEIEFYIGRVQHSSTFKTKLEKCHEQLAMLFDHNYRVDNIKDHIFLDQIVACKLDNGRFYRGAVVEKLESDDYRVALVDTGHEAVLSRMNIYTIRASCLSDPPLSIMASLRVKPANGELNWSEQALRLFRSTVAEQEYMLCRVMSLEMEQVYTVDLLSISTRSSLTDQLIQQGLAEPTFASP